MNKKTHKPISIWKSIYRQLLTYYWLKLSRHMLRLYHGEQLSHKKDLWVVPSYWFHYTNNLRRRYKIVIAQDDLAHPICDYLQDRKNNEDEYVVPEEYDYLREEV